MSYEKFKKMRGISSSTSKLENPYVSKAVNKTELKDINTDDLGEFNLSNQEKDKVLMTNSILNGQNKYLLGVINNQAREIKELKEDIGSLYAIIMNPEGVSALTPEETKEAYFDFKKDPRHLLNRKIKKWTGSGIEGE